MKANTKVNRHTAILDKYVRVVNTNSHYDTCEGFVFAIDPHVDYAWVQFGHGRQYAQMPIAFEHLELVEGQ